VQQVTIEKLRWLLAKAIAGFGERRIGELTSQEIAAWRMTLAAGHRFEATQAPRQVLHRAVAWGMNGSLANALYLAWPSPLETVVRLREGLHSKYTDH
jgi:hypothetical protein